MSARYRPRRTRVYNANYDIGQSYYKSALDNLDKKYSSTASSSLGSTEASASRASPHIRFNLDEQDFQDELQSARNRASRAITEDSVLDSRSSRMMKSALSSTSAYADDLDEDVQASLTRIRANRKNIAALTNDLDLEDTFSKVKRRSNLDFGEKLLDVAGEDDIGTSIRSRALKIVSRTEEPVVTSTTKSIMSSFKSTAISDSSESMSSSAASMRAKATKARLADIETDINDRSTRLLERERRAANIKKLLAENDIEEVKPSRKMIAF